MGTEQLILDLARDAGPVRRLARPRTRLLGWLAWTGAVVVVSAAAVGPRQDLPEMLHDVSYLAQAVTLVLALVSAGLAALLTSVPGALGGRLVRWLPIAALALWILWLAVELGLAVVSGAPFPWEPGTVWKCARSVVAMGALPGVVLFWLVVRGAPVERRWAGMFTLLALAIAGALTIHFDCPNDAPFHVLVAHALPVTMLLAGGALLGRTMYRA